MRIATKMVKNTFPKPPNSAFNRYQKKRIIDMHENLRLGEGQVACAAKIRSIMKDLIDDKVFTSKVKYESVRHVIRHYKAAIAKSKPKSK